MQVATCDGPPPAVPHLIPVVSRHRYGFVHFADTEEGETAAEHAIAKLGTAVALLHGRLAPCVVDEATIEGEAPPATPIELLTARLRRLKYRYWCGSSTACNLVYCSVSWTESGCSSVPSSAASCWYQTGWLHNAGSSSTSSTSDVCPV